MLDGRTESRGAGTEEGRAAAVGRVLAAARGFLGERITASAALREQHSRGEDHVPPSLPDAVAFVETPEEAARLLGLCNEHRVPVVPWGAGTSSEGHVTPVRGGVVVNLSRMTRVLEVNAADMDALVQAGVTRQQLDLHLRDQGLFFPVDPGSEATIGGMCGTRASGTNAVRYGTMRENVLGLTVALADGRLIRTGGRVRKSSTGYDLTRLFIGSEGTLGIIAEVRLRLHGIPEQASAAVCQFERLEGAVATAIAVRQAGVEVARLELLDDVQMGACIAYSRLEGMLPRPTLFFEFHGSRASVREQAELCDEIAQGLGASGFEWATDEAARRRLWKARHDAYWAARALRPGFTGVGTDAVVPISRLGDMIAGAKRDIEASGLCAPIIGHVGDGNFHSMILLPPGEPLERAFALDRKIAERAVSLGGACSGEHGIGVSKRGLMAQEHGPDVLDVMRKLKVALDPRGILNPGKLLPEAPG